MRVIFLVLAGLIAAGCVTTAQPGPQQRLLGSEIQTLTNYTLGEAQSAYVGSEMIRVQDFRVDTYGGSVVTISQDFEISGPTFAATFNQGQTFNIAGSVDIDGSRYRYFNAYARGIIFDDTGTIIPKVLNAGVVMFYDFDVSEAGRVLELGNRSDARVLPQGRNFQLIYSGVTSDHIRIAYREFTDGDMARQAFFQDLTYPRNETEIRFRGMRIGVEEANASEIRFTVLEEEPAPELQGSRQQGKG